MQVSDINAECRSLCSADSTGLTDAVLLRRLNSAYERVVGEIIGVNGDFQWDDTNWSDIPIATTDLVSNQQNYNFDVAFLDLIGVSIMDANGKYQALIPIDQRDMGTSQNGNSSGSLNRSGKVDPSQFESTAGMPIYYDKSGTTLMLYPKPVSGSVTLTAGLKLYYQRTADLFTSAQVTAGTKSPGFISTYHEILPYMMAIPYCTSFKRDRVALYEKRVGEIMKALLARYSRRSKDERASLKMNTESCR